MKKALVGLMVALMAVSSFGGLFVAWEGYGFQSGADASIGALQDSSTTQIIWDLVYTTSDSINASLNESTGAIEYGSDVVISERIINPTTPSGDVYGIGNVTDCLATAEPSQTPIEFGDYVWAVNGEYMLYKNADPGYSSGNIYSAIFQYTESGDVYAAFTELVTPNWANDGKGALDFANFSMDSDTGMEYFGHVSQIPEPATMSLLGLGALAMMIRRKLRK